LVIGVNGTGKTTTIAKLAKRYKDEGKKVLIAAGDTYRAAAVEQLGVWARRAGVDLIESRMGQDPAAVAYDAVAGARSRGAEVLIIDTAGRLHTKSNLMEELVKVKRVIAKHDPGFPQEVLLVLDATTGQNAISQAKLFTGAVGVTGIALTKLDGTARGGIVIAIAKELGIPVKYIGVGEKLDDLADFDPAAFAEALIGQ
jgi:fused signal recognition particle receptor